MIGRTAFFGLTGAFCLTLPAHSQTVVDEILVTATRLPPAASEPLFATTVIDRSRLEQAGFRRLDEVLREVPGFTLFRRQASRASHPTTQGVTLRGLGPSGAGRTLVLLDGVPQNDPFGGWIDWSRLPPDAFASAAVTRGGGAGPWGNAALAGTIRLERRVPRDSEFAAHASGNSYGGVDASAFAHLPSGRATLSFGAAGHEGEGPFPILARQRGLVDRPTEERGGVVQAGLTIDVREATTVSATAAASVNSYVNGIDIARSRSRIADAAVAIVHSPGPTEIGWQANAYIRDQDLPAVFAAVTPDRAQASPSLDQFKVPAQAIGGSALIRMPAGAVIFDVGADVRRVRGATHELFQFAGGAFTRLREAGGAQVIGGAFVESTWQPRSAVTLTAAARIDGWRQFNGRRREAVVGVGTVVRSDRYAARNGSVGNFRAGARFALGDDLELRAAAYSGFRVPTLNELYRPFRVGNDITEANPELRPERLWGAELGAIWSPDPRMRLTITAFGARLKDAVGNVTITTRPGLEPTLGVFVPVQGVLRQRRNIDRVRAEGAEIEFDWTPHTAVDLTVRYLYTAPRVHRSRAQPALDGLRLAQVARHQATAVATWRVAPAWELRLDVTGAGPQFEDDLNTRRLAGYVLAGATAEYALGSQAAVFVSMDNLFDRVVEAGRSADGLITVAGGRAVTAGLRLRR